MTVQIDLTGPQGNAAALMMLARDFGRQCGYPRARIEQITTAMRRTSYAGVLNELEFAFPGIDFEFNGDPRQERPGDEDD